MVSTMVSLGRAAAAFLLVWAALLAPPTAALLGIQGEDSPKYNNKHKKQVVQSVVRYLLKKHEQEASRRMSRMVCTNTIPQFCYKVSC